MHMLTVVSATLDEGVDMSIIGKIRGTRTPGRKRAGSSLARALEAAPTRSSREELLQLRNMGR